MLTVKISDHWEFLLVVYFFFCLLTYKISQKYSSIANLDAFAEIFMRSMNRASGLHFSKQNQVVFPKK